MSYKFAEEIASETIGFVVTPVTVVSPSRALFSLMLFLPLRISDFFCIIQAWEIFKSTPPSFSIWPRRDMEMVLGAICVRRVRPPLCRRRRFGRKSEFYSSYQALALDRQART